MGLPPYIDAEFLFMILLGCASLAAGIFATMWAVLTVRRVIGARIAIVLCIATLLAVIPVYLTGITGQEAAEIFILYLATAVCLLGGCCVMRRFGYRLVWQRRAKQSVRDSMSTKAAGSGTWLITPTPSKSKPPEAKAVGYGSFTGLLTESSVA